MCQKLSEDFIREFKDEVNWDNIPVYQELSENFIKDLIKEFKYYINTEAYDASHKEKPYEQKLLEVKEYAKKHNLKIDENYLYAFREHDRFGRGVYNKTISYENNKYYRDWHCDMNEYEENSFGLGIWPKGNTKIKVKIEDWGCEVKNDSKARVWGFTIV
jgi:hypothetical protein